MSGLPVAAALWRLRGVGFIRVGIGGTQAIERLSVAAEAIASAVGAAPSRLGSKAARERARQREARKRGLGRRLLREHQHAFRPFSSAQHASDKPSSSALT